MRQVKYFDLTAQYKSIKPEIDEAIQRVVNRQSFIQGEEVEAFEKEWAEYCGVDYCVAVNSGTAALHLSLLALGIGKGDEVITVPNSFIATAEAIAYTGAKPVFVDVDENTFNIDVSKIESAINERTKAIILVHLYGLPCDMKRISYIAYKHNLVVIEDACQAHGAIYNGAKVGSLGDCGCFSFYPSKIIGTYGEGGCIVTDDVDLSHGIRDPWDKLKIHQKVKDLRDHGQEPKNFHNVIGYNYRMPEIQAAVLRVKLKYLDQWIEARQKKARLYDKILSSYTGKYYSIFSIQLNNTYSYHVYYVYIIRVKDRDNVRIRLQEEYGINTQVHYPIPIHLQPAFKYLNYKEGDFPIVEQLASEILSLPLYPEMSDADVEYVCKCLKEVL